MDECLTSCGGANGGGGNYLDLVDDNDDKSMQDRAVEIQIRRL